MTAQQRNLFENSPMEGVTGNSDNLSVKLNNFQEIVGLENGL